MQPLMKALCVHSHRFLVRGAEVLTPRGGHYGIWSRYLGAFDEVEVVGRPLPRGARETARLAANGPGVTFTLVSDIFADVPGLPSRLREVRERLRERLRSSDALIANNTTMGLIAAGLATELSVPTMLEVIGAPGSSYWNHGSFAGRLLAPLEEIRSRRAIKRADFVSYVTQEFLQRRYPTDGRSIASSDVELPPLSPAVWDAREAKIGDGTVKEIGLIGGLDLKYKGLDVAFEALAILVADGWDLTLRVVGDGDSAHWRRRASALGLAERVRIEAPLTTMEEVVAWMDEIDLYIQPSLTEGLPRAVLEAMSRGCPVVASDVGGLPEILPSAVLVEAGKPAALAKTIVGLIDDPEALRARGRENLEIAKRFESEALDARRSAFLREFRVFAEQQG